MYAHNSTDDQYKLLNMHKMPPTIIVDYNTRTQFHRQSIKTAKHTDTITLTIIINY